ncbi:hypothetical protein [Ponticaulis sp.]|uniref:hypothetical protein n=1 Tax=Ponticaulis sp. TaxID=2020902 RepID=UPI000B626FCF|nr:hypothetical protein [Ponticaulis sp.]MAI91882.1 hypothetical protein [Ponticaulis sp.]OUX96563.1 MAG: hypothetical protein CBB65_15740 [Hyphomonadaceae bacterium TMED5]|tara:strand:- start:266 stop:691 length:426 start_codon:yes stop_codon:yes gene_type:complete
MNARLSRLFATRIDTVSDIAELEFEAGQIWTMTDDGYAGVSVLVTKVERHKTLGASVHVSIRGTLRTKGGSELEGVPHLPFTPEALAASNLDLIGYINDLPDDWEDMYEDWLSDAEMGEAGLFSLPVCEVLDTIMSKLAWL